MELAFSPEQEELIRTLRAFVRRELAPHSREWDKRAEFPWAAWKQMGAMGLFGLRAPAAYGGQEADLVTTGIAMEEGGRGASACRYGIRPAGWPTEAIATT